MFVIRDYTPDDFAFVKSSWIKQQALAHPFRLMRSSEFFNSYSPLLDEKISNISIKILCNKDYPEQAFGHIAYSPKTLHFIYVKGLYRNFKLSHKLLDAAFAEEIPVYYTHLSDNKFFRLMVRKKKMIYNPFKFQESVSD